MINLAIVCSLIGGAFAAAKKNEVPLRGGAFQNQSPSSQHQQLLVGFSEDVIWQWEEDTGVMAESLTSFHELDEDTHFLEATKPKRKLIWLGRMEEGSYKPSYRRRYRRTRPTSTVSPHTLRMDQWNITLAWRENKRERDSLMSFEFHENGYVRCLHPNTTKSRDPPTSRIKHLLSRLHTRNQGKGAQSSMRQQNPTYIVGKWKLAPSGIIWKLTWDDSTYSFYADLHLNPFGKYPKMFRGMVIRDRNVLPPRFLRPLVATFSGMGVGKDTADFSYKKRKFGTNQ